MLQNIIMPLTLDRRKPDGEYLDDIVSFLGLKDKLRRYPDELSGGEQQRAAIARSVIAKPELIFADEPTGNLDRRTGMETMELLRESASRCGGTLVVVTHDPDVAAMADAVIHLDDGQVQK